MTHPARAAYLLALVIATQVPALGEVNWPRWRGPDGTGHAQDANLPVKWSDENLAWKTELPGAGQSSPIVWGDKIFLTAALNSGKERIVLCLSRTDGKLLWQQTAWTGDAEPSHQMNHWASATCVTDGEHVVAFFGRGGIHCFDFSGKKLWSKDLGKFESPWGTAASPVILGDMVIQNCDADDQAYIVALDKKSGDQIWRTERPKVRGWSTPILVETGSRTELVMNGHTGTTAYDPKSGKELWFCKGSSGRGTPTVVPYKGMLVAVNGRPGDMYAVKPGGSGTVNGSHEVWRTRRKAGRDLPSPIVLNDDLLVVSLRPGLATSYDAASGEERSKMRLDGSFSASPIAANGLAYIPSESGDVFVLRTSPKLDVVAKNTLKVSDEEIFRASITPHNGELLIRSTKVLYCVKK